MKTVGIIAEYNPFHNGHQYQLEEAKKRTGADYVIVVMSGDFTQRGAPAIYGKELRTRMALSCGADLVFEMPVFGTVAAAMDFAECGVSLLCRSGIVDFLSFGSESGNLEELEKMAAFFSAETPEISAKIQEGLRMGLPWPTARERAFGGGVHTPNDILAAEYLKALKNRNSSILPIPVARIGSGYHSEEVNSSFASATAARKLLSNRSSKDLEVLRRILPETFFAIQGSQNYPEIFPEDLTFPLNMKLRTMSQEALSQISQMPEDLARKLFRGRLDYRDAEEWIFWAKDRQYTYARVSRCLANLVLGITKEETDAFKAFESAPWLRILGFRKEAAPLLSALQKKAQIPVITKTAAARKQLDSDALRLFFRHLECADLYRLLAEQKTGRPMKNEYTRPLVIL